VARVTGVMVKTVGMEFFCYHRDRPGSVTLREELLEEHWSYMDRYATEMIARGPTLAGDGDTRTGSVHIVGLPDPAAARAFAQGCRHVAGLPKPLPSHRLHAHLRWVHPAD
jgi:hypothetical protein